MNPAVSMVAPAPMVTPVGLIRNTRPFDSSCPRIFDGSPPVTRLSTALAAPDCTKRVISSGRIENCCQLMIVPGALVMVSVWPLTEKVACPAATLAPPGFAAAGIAKQAAMASGSARRTKARGARAGNIGRDTGNMRRETATGVQVSPSGGTNSTQKGAFRAAPGRKAHRE